MQYAKYKIQCRLLEDANLPEYKGSMLRGAFGNALKKAVCTVQNKDCIQCLLYKRCLFSTLFEPQIRRQQDNCKKNPPIAPHPYIIEPPLDSKIQYKRGEILDFELILLGESCEHLVFFVYAFELMGKSGIAKNQTNGFRVAFELINVFNNSIPIYNAGEQKLIEVTNFEILNSNFPTYNESSKNKKVQVKLSLLTPLRYKNDNHFANTLSFESLYILMTRRVNTIFNHFANVEVNIPFHELFNLSKEVKIIDSNIVWKDFRRFSTRQNSKLLIGGLVGNVCYEGDLLAFIPLLDLASKLHLGKQTSFGLGKITYTLLNT